MLLLVNNINLMIGDVIPEDDEVWELLLQLRNLVQIVTSRYVIKNTYIQLHVFVHEYSSSLCK